MPVAVACDTPDQDPLTPDIPTDSIPIGAAFRMQGLWNNHRAPCLDEMPN